MDQYGESFTVVNGRFIKPFDTELLEEHARIYDHIFTMEDGGSQGEVSLLNTRILE